MPFITISRDKIDPEQWEKLASRYSFYHTLSWADICTEGMDKDASPLFLVAGNGNDYRAAMCGITTRQFGFRSFYSMPYDTYGGILFTPEVDTVGREGMTAEAAGILKGEGFSLIRICDFDNRIGHIADLGFERRAAFTHILELTEEEYRPPDKMLQRNLRSGERHEYEIRKIEADAEIASYYALYRRTERRHGHKRPMYSHKFIEQILKYMGRSEKLYFAGLFIADRMIGARIDFIHNDTLYHWQGVSDYEMRSFRPNHILMFEAIRYAQARGVKYINLGASPPEAAGLIEYKERWGAKKYDYNIYVARSGLRKILGR